MRTMRPMKMPLMTRRAWRAWRASRALSFAWCFWFMVVNGLCAHWQAAGGVKRVSGAPFLPFRLSSCLFLDISNGIIGQFILSPLPSKAFKERSEQFFKPVQHPFRQIP